MVRIVIISLLSMSLVGCFSRDVPELTDREFSSQANKVSIDFDGDDWDEYLGEGEHGFRYMSEDKSGILDLFDLDLGMFLSRDAYARYELKSFLVHDLLYVDTGASDASNLGLFNASSQAEVAIFTDYKGQNRGVLHLKGYDFWSFVGTLDGDDFAIRNISSEQFYYNDDELDQKRLFAIYKEDHLVAKVVIGYNYDWGKTPFDFYFSKTLDRNNQHQVLQIMASAYMYMRTYESISEDEYDDY